MLSANYEWKSQGGKGTLNCKGEKQNRISGHCDLSKKIAISFHFSKKSVPLIVMIATYYYICLWLLRQRIYSKHVSWIKMKFLEYYFFILHFILDCKPEFRPNVKNYFSRFNSFSRKQLYIKTRWKMGSHSGGWGPNVSGQPHVD